MDGPDISPLRGHEGNREPAGARLRLLCVDGALGLESLAPLADLPIEVVREAGPTRALERLEMDGDFAVLVCEESVGGTSGLALLSTVGTISPTTSRLIVSERLSREPSKEAAELVFRCISPHASSSELCAAIRDALEYHQLLATCPAQPVEGRLERMAIPPPAKPASLRPETPVWSRLRGTPDGGAGLLLVDAPAASTDLVVLGPRTARVGLNVVGRIVELLPGLTVVGRSRTCHIPIPDPKISRRHATFSNTGSEVHVRNVSSTSSVRVNGTALPRDVEHPLSVGDRIRLGDHDIEVCALGDYCPSLEPTQTGALPEGPPVGTVQLATLFTLAHVADKYFALGHVREAERILRPLLEGLLRHCEARNTPAPADVELATRLTVRMAEANHAGEWIDYLFQLFTALERPMPADLVECLYRVVPDSVGMKIGCFRAYLDMLGRNAERFGPKERFLIRRIQGLESPIMISAHV